MPRDFAPTETAPVDPCLNAWPAPSAGLDTCQYMAGDPDVGDAGKCGLPVVGRRPYCAAHRRLCVRPPVPFKQLLRLAGVLGPGQ